MIIKQGNSKAKVSAPKPVVVQKPSSGGMKGGTGQAGKSASKSRYGK